MMKLRPYQERTVRKTLQALRSGKAGVLVQGPCGCGKTEISIEVIRQLGKRWVFVTPNAVLATQAEARLRLAGMECARYGVAHENVASDAPIQVTTIQMVLTRDAEKKLRPDFICFDEAHHYEAEAWSDYAARYPKAQRMGLTATPERDDGQSLLRHFDEVVVAATYKELIDQGVLVPARVYTSVTSNPIGLAMDPIEAWVRFACGRRTIMACGFIKEAREWAERFNAEQQLRQRGIVAASVDGETPRRYNQKVLQDFRDGKVHIITNVYYIAEGFDLPEIGCVMFARRFQFRGTYVQFGGRALRAAPGKKDAIGIDLTGCSYRHGHPHGDYPWILGEQDKPERGTGQGDGEGDGRRRKPLDVVKEGLVRVAHGALKPTDPDPAPFVPLSLLRHVMVKERLRIENAARKMAGRKGVTAAQAWAAREKKRHLRVVASSGPEDEGPRAA